MLLKTEDNKEHTLLLIDDEPDNLSLLYRTLRHGYKIFKTVSPIEALEILKNNEIDVIISDHKMEEMDGVEFLRRSYEINPNCIRLLVTAYSDSRILIDAINKGKVYRYIKKPWEPSELKLTVDSAIEYHKLNNENNKLIYDLKDLFTGTVNAIIEALDAKNPLTIGRSKKVAFLARKVGEELNIPNSELGKLELAALLHDIGLIGVPEDILGKPDAFNEDEKKQYEKHVEYGIKILKDIKQLKDIIEIIKYHHEKIDGNGYPQGLKGDEIPLSSLIISICDKYESLMKDRKMSHEEALQYLDTKANRSYPTHLISAFKTALEKAKDTYDAINE